MSIEFFCFDSFFDVGMVKASKNQTVWIVKTGLMRSVLYSIAPTIASGGPSNGHKPALSSVPDTQIILRR